MSADEEGFLRPEVDADKCMVCGRCEKACPVNNPEESRTPLSVYAAMANDPETRLASSSGGVFSLLARQTIEKGGVVYGVSWDLPNYGARFMAARTEVELAELRGSKYVQAEVGQIYCDVRSSLEAGKPVLFSGTPCQVAALRAVLGNEHKHLLTVEVICHAVPSPLVFRRYLEEREQKANDRSLRVFHRAKQPSWERFCQVISFHDNASGYSRPLYRDPYLRGFIRDVYNRPSCAQCSFKNLCSGADITLGDYWGIKKVMPALYDDRGTSAVLVNTERGASAFSEITSKLHCAQSTFEDVVRFNPALVKSTPLSKHRARFFAKLPKSRSFTRLVMPLSRFPVRFWVFLFLGMVKRKIVKLLSSHLSTLN